MTNGHKNGNINVHTLAHLHTIKIRGRYFTLCSFFYIYVGRQWWWWWWWRWWSLSIKLQSMNENFFFLNPTQNTNARNVRLLCTHTNMNMNMLNTPKVFKMWFRLYLIGYGLLLVYLHASFSASFFTLMEKNFFGLFFFFLVSFCNSSVSVYYFLLLLFSIIFTFTHADWCVCVWKLKKEKKFFFFFQFIIIIWHHQRTTPFFCLFVCVTRARARVSFH